MAEKDNIREQIVQAAKKRFSHFGYAKTTMAEVATDCCMSPGNLYRFYPGKLDIAEAIATEDYTKHLDHLRKLAVGAGQGCAANGCTISCSRNCAAPITSSKRIRAPTRWRW